MINTYTLGNAPDRPPLLIVHGLFGSARNWGAIAKRLAADRQVITVDMRNHGASPWADSHGYDDLADDLDEVIQANGGRADVIGHSMGGKAAMALALTAPDRINRLVVGDIAPVAYAHSQSSLVRAMQGLDLTGLASRGEADARLAQTVPEAPVRAFLLQSLDLKTDPPSWRLNLDVLEREMDRMVGWPGYDAQFGGPTLFLAGETSDYIRPEYHDAILRLFPNAEFGTVANAGHWLHAENPRGFLEAVTAFLSAG
jgi:pimeloyl-ACP methyl ester carboxylesterase